MADTPQEEILGGDDDLPDRPKRSLRDLIRFQEWQNKKERTSAELRAKLRAEIEKLFVARSWPSIVDIIGPFRVYGEGLFDVDAEFLLEEERDTVLEYEARLLRETEHLQHIFGYVIRGSSDGGKTFSDGGRPEFGLYKEIVSEAINLRTLTLGTADLEGSSEAERPRDFYLDVDISPHIRASLKDRIYRWTAEFQSRRGPLGRLYLIDAQRSTATQKTGADDGSAPAKKAPGRHKGSVVDAARLREYREGGGWSQADFASKCAVSLSTIQRGESGGPWGKGIFDKVAGTLTTLTEKHCYPKRPQEASRIVSDLFCCCPERSRIA